MQGDVVRPSVADDLQPGDVFWNRGPDGTELCVALLYRGETPKNKHVSLIALGHELMMGVWDNDELPSPLSRLEGCKLVIWEESLCGSNTRELAHQIVGLLVNADGIWMRINNNQWADLEHGKFVHTAPAAPWLGYSQASIMHGDRTLAYMRAGGWQLKQRELEWHRGT